MFIVRDIFQLKFGQSKEATALWKQGVTHIASKAKGGARLLTDVAGAPYYTIILESTWESLSQWEQATKGVRSDPEWQKWYQKVVALTESGRREILSIIE